MIGVARRVAQSSPERSSAPVDRDALLRSAKTDRRGAATCPTRGSRRAGTCWAAIHGARCSPGPGRRPAASAPATRPRSWRRRCGPKPRQSVGSDGTDPGQATFPKACHGGAWSAPADALAQHVVGAGEDDAPEHQRREHAEQDAVCRLPRATIGRRRFLGWGFCRRRLRRSVNARHFASP